jgi:2-amino-4-hydroxy-6-hydroxymethyldihydropteridine diphosphokinase
MNVIIGLGSNMGDRLANLRNALVAIKATPFITVLKSSPIYETPPWGAVGSPAFLNACALLKTELPLDSLLGVGLGIESAMGRMRDIQDQFAPRTIDIDILFAGELVSHAAHLYVPHPRLHLRAFALKPALDVWPHPQLEQWFDLPTVRADAAQMTKTSDVL